VLLPTKALYRLLKNVTSEGKTRDSSISEAGFDFASTPSLHKYLFALRGGGAVCCEAVKNEAQKRSLYGVNEHFKRNFDTELASVVVFQHPLNRGTL
jgi:hypothetical protein